jgi:hypothetical protein
LAQDLIKELHPIKDTKIEVSFPVAFFFVGPVRKMWKYFNPEAPVVDLMEPMLDEGLQDKIDKASTPEAKKILKLQQKQQEKKQKLKTQLTKKKTMKKNNEDDHDHDEKDSYLSLGFGLIAYRSTLWSLSLTFIIMSIIVYPMIISYEKGGAIDTEINDTKYGVFSLANLGYSTVQCATMPFNQKTLTLTCPYGMITNIVDEGNGFGVTPFDSPARDACLRNEEKYMNNACSEKLNQEAVKTFFAANCFGKISCDIEIQDPSLLGTLQFTKDGKCDDNRAHFFIQYTCE